MGAYEYGATPGGDVTDPVVEITTINGESNSSATYSTSSSTVTLAGTVYDAVGVVANGVTWANNRGGSGTATCANCNGTAGTKDWSQSNITLQSGVNVITISGRDDIPNTGTDTLTVTYTIIDTDPPIISSPLPSTQQSCKGLGFTDVSLSVVTHEASTCRMVSSVDGNTNTTYASMTDTFTTTGGVNHSETKNLACGPAYVYYVRCADALGNPNTTSTPISFSIERIGVVDGGISIPGGVSIQ